MPPIVINIGGQFISLNNSIFESDGQRIDSQKLAVVSNAPPTPPTTTGLFAWYRGDQLITLNSTTVSGWGDLTSNHIDLAQSTAGSQFLYTSSDTNLNNQSTVTGSGTQYMQTITNKPPADTAANGTTIMLVAYFTSFVGRIGYFHIGDSATDTTAGNITGFIDTNGAIGICDSNNYNNWDMNGPGPGAINTNTKYYVVVRANNGVNNGASVRVNGVEKWTNGTLGTFTGWPANKGLFLGIGRIGNLSIANDFTGELAEMVFFNSRISDSDVTAWESYFHTRYNI